MTLPALSISGRLLAVAPYFQLDGGWADRLQVRDGERWRAPSAGELAAWARPDVRREALESAVCLFALPAHLRASFWAMLEQGGVGGFSGFAAEVAKFLAFKQLAPPEGAVFELVLNQPVMPTEMGPGDVWGVLNLGEESVSAVVPDVQVRLGPCEGCRVPGGVRLTVWAEESQEPGVLVVVRTAPRAPEA